MSPQFTCSLVHVLIRCRCTTSFTWNFKFMFQTWITARNNMIGWYWSRFLVMDGTLSSSVADFVSWNYMSQMWTAKLNKILLLFSQMLATMTSSETSHCYHRDANSLYLRGRLPIFVNILSIFMHKFGNLLISGKFCAIDFACNVETLLFFIWMVHISWMLMLVSDSSLPLTTWSLRRVIIACCLWVAAFTFPHIC